MSGARVLLCTHCLVATASIASVAYALGRNLQLEGFFSDSVVLWIYVLVILSSFAFTACIAYLTAGRMPVWRWCPIVLADIVLGLVQFLALLVVYPVRS